MKPLATPVLGGMVSSLLHVLIVTPAIFYSLRARELRREETHRVTESEACSSSNKQSAPASDAAIALNEVSHE
jgi:hypothetical protein